MVKSRFGALDLALRPRLFYPTPYIIKARSKKWKKFLSEKDTCRLAEKGFCSEENYYWDMTIKFN